MHQRKHATGPRLPPTSQLRSTPYLPRTLSLALWLLGALLQAPLLSCVQPRDEAIPGGTDGGGPAAPGNPTASGGAGSPGAGGASQAGGAAGSDGNGAPMDAGSAPAPQDGQAGNGSTSDANPMSAHQLLVAPAGDGRIESDDGIISCPGRCAASYTESRTVTLRAVEGETGVFTSWAQACTGKGACAVRVEGLVTVTATFRNVTAWTRPLARTQDVAVAGDEVYVIGYFREETDLGGMSVTSAGDNDVFVARFDVTGKLVWLRTFGGPGIDDGRAVAALPGGGIVTTGSLDSARLDASGRVVPAEPNSTYFFLAWFSGAGELVRVLPENGGLTVAADADGTVAVGSVPLAKYAPNGSKIWEATELFNRFVPEKVVFDAAGNLVVANTFQEPLVLGGRTHVPVGGSDVVVAKFTRAGTLAWSAPVGGPRGDFPTGLAIDGDGHVYVGGEIFDQASSPDTRDTFLEALDGGDGSQRWSRSFVMPGYDRLGGLLASDGIVTAGIRIANQGDLGGGLLGGGSRLAMFDAATGRYLSSKATGLFFPAVLARHQSGDVLAVDWGLSRLAVR